MSRSEHSINKSIYVSHHITWCCTSALLISDPTHKTHKYKNTHMRRSKRRRRRPRRGDKSKRRPRRADKSIELHPIRYRTVTSGAGARGHHSLDTNRQVASLVATEFGKVRSSELAVEESIELCILRRLLAIRDLQPVGLQTVARCQGKKVSRNDGDGGESTYRIPRLLNEYLSQADHLRVILKSLGKVDHFIRSILLVAILACSEKGRECGLRNWVALASTASFNL